MPARVLLAVAPENSPANLSTVLRRDGHEVATIGLGADALRVWNLQSPDLLVLDAGLPDIDGFEVVRRVRDAEGGSAHVPIVLVGPADMPSKIQGLRAGADDYVNQPVHPHELTARVRALLVRHGAVAVPDKPVASRQTSGKVHAYYGAKGGVGNTTLAINTAIALRQETKRSVALVDANLQFGDHRVFLDLGTDRRSIVDACTATAIDADVVRRVVEHHPSGLDLMLAPTTPEAAELINHEQHHLQQVVEVLRGMYDYVVIDLDQRLDDHALDVIGIADALLVVLTADLACLKNVRILLETMDQIGVPAERMQLVLNRNKAFTGISIKSVESVLRRPVEHQVVNDYRTAMASLNSGTPFMLNAADSPVGRAIVQLARSVSGVQPAPAPSSKSRKLVAVPG